MKKRLDLVIFSWEALNSSITKYIVYLISHIQAGQLTQVYADVNGARANSGVKILTAANLWYHDVICHLRLFNFLESGTEDIPLLQNPIRSFGQWDSAFEYYPHQESNINNAVKCRFSISSLLEDFRIAEYAVIKTLEIGKQQGLNNITLKTVRILLFKLHAVSSYLILCLFYLLSCLVARCKATTD